MEIFPFATEDATNGHHPQETTASGYVQGVPLEKDIPVTVL